MAKKDGSSLRAPASAGAASPQSAWTTKVPADTHPRCELALRASWQVEHLFVALLAQPLDNVESSMVRAIALRGRDLSRSIMAMLDDSMASVEEHAVRVLGENDPTFDVGGANG